MIKKLFITTLLIFSLCNVALPMFSAVPIAVAQESADSLDSPDFMFNLRAITHEDIKEEKFIKGGINFIFERVITVMAITVSSAAVLMITVGGFMILASGGRQQWVDNGKTFIFKSIIGLAVTLGAYIFVTTVQVLINNIYG